MNIFVTGFPKTFEKKELIKLFETYGKVESATVIMVKEPSGLKRFGFVEMPNEEEAKQSIELLHDTMLDGRKLTVIKTLSQDRK